MFEGKLKCDICGSPMEMTPRPGNIDGEAFNFECSSPTCKQGWYFNKDGNSGCAILKHLWPSSMTEEWPMYRNEFVPEWLAKHEFCIHANVLAGFKTLDEARKEYEERKETFDQWYIDHPEPEKNKPAKKWYEFWK